MKNIQKVILVTIKFFAISCAFSSTSTDNDTSPNLQNGPKIETIDIRKQNSKDNDTSPNLQNGPKIETIDIKKQNSTDLNKQEQENIKKEWSTYDKLDKRDQKKKIADLKIAANQIVDILELIDITIHRLKTKNYCRAVEGFEVLIDCLKVLPLTIRTFAKNPNVIKKIMKFKFKSIYERLQTEDIEKIKPFLVYLAKIIDGKDVDFSNLPEDIACTEPQKIVSRSEKDEKKIYSEIMQFFINARFEVSKIAKKSSKNYKNLEKQFKDISTKEDNFTEFEKLSNEKLPSNEEVFKPLEGKYYIVKTDEKTTEGNVFDGIKKEWEDKTFNNDKRENTLITNCYSIVKIFEDIFNLIEMTKKYDKEKNFKKIESCYKTLFLDISNFHKNFKGITRYKYTSVEVHKYWITKVFDIFKEARNSDPLKSALIILAKIVNKENFDVSQIKYNKKIISNLLISKKMTQLIKAEAELGSFLKTFNHDEDISKNIVEEVKNFANNIMSNDNEIAFYRSKFKKIINSQ